VSSFARAITERVLVLDGGIGTSLLATEPGDGEREAGAKRCLDLTCLDQPERVQAVHEGFLAAGSDAIETNTFLASPLALAEFGCAEQAREVNLAGARIARAAADRYAREDSPRFVLGAMGPGTRLPSLGQVDEATLSESYRVQADALVEGGVDALAIETCQDPRQIHAALRACLEARARAGREVGLLVSITVEVTGALLVGASLADVVEELADQPLDVLGLNCALGPREMNEHVQVLATRSPFRLGVYPNAGLPQIVDGKPTYPLTPDELADWLSRFVLEDGARLVGGCCGTTPAHIAAVVERLRTRAQEAPSSGAGEAASGRTQLPFPELPFAGPRTIDSIPLRTVVPLVDEERLERFHWRHLRGGPAPGGRAAARSSGSRVRRRFLDLARTAESDAVLTPRGAFGFWRARKDGDQLTLLEPDSGAQGLRVSLPRQHGRRGLCLTDFIAGAGCPDGLDTVGLCLVTLGSRIEDVVREHFRAGREEEYRELTGLATEVLAGAAEVIHRQMRAEWGIAGEDARETSALLAGGYRGARFAFGSPPLPGGEATTQALELLGATRMGVELDPEGSLTPLYSEVFLVLHDPTARFFAP